MANTSPTLLIDGDILLYESCAANEEEINWGDDLWTLHSDLKVCKATLSDKIEKLKRDLETPNVIFCISDVGENNFRLKVLPSYKSKRKTTRKPLAYKALKEWAIEQYPYALWPNLEADDVCGILATTKGDTEYIVVSEDKDLKTIPCTLYRKGELKTYTEDEADYWFFYQTLVGDITDGYKGCPGIGDKTAQKILADFEVYRNPWPTVVRYYEAAGLTEEDALAQARCARILRSTDWDAKKKQVKLWEPPKTTNSETINATIQ